MPLGGFLNEPGKTTFDELVARAEKAKCGEQVRAAALRFLETGKSPFQWIASPKAGQTIRVDSAWPLPVPDYLMPLMRPSDRTIAPHGPHYDVLLDMAIAAKRPDDVLRWYDKMLGGRKRERPRMEQIFYRSTPTALPQRWPSPIPSGPWTSIVGSWMALCRRPTSRPMNQRPVISRRCGRS